MVVVAVKKWPPKEEVSPQFPVRECENCGFFLEDFPAKATEKGVGSDGRLIYNDHCPRCGRGYAVWTASDKAAPDPELEPGATTGAPARVYDVPEELVAEADEEAPNIYFCTKCKKNHMPSSKLGRAHLKHKGNVKVIVPDLIEDN